MAPLPQIQLALPLQAFLRCAVDFDGSFLTKQGRGKKSKTVFVPVYMPSFLCSTFRNCIWIGHRFIVKCILQNDKSKRASSWDVIWQRHKFCGDEPKLRELIEKLDAEKIVASGADEGIKWNSNPPLATHFGGVHESTIKSAKKAIKAIAGNADVNDEELMTIFTGAKSLLNSQPDILNFKPRRWNTFNSKSLSS